MKNILIIAPVSQPADGMSMQLSSDGETHTHNAANFGPSNLSAAIESAITGETLADALTEIGFDLDLTGYVTRTDSEDGEAWDLTKVNVRVGPDPSGGLVAAGLQKYPVEA